MNRRIFIGMAAFLFFVGAAHGQSADAGKLAEFRKTVQSMVDKNEFAGAVTIVGRKDGVVIHEAIGFQDIEKKQPMKKDAIFRIKSMTKPITCIGVMILVDEKKLSIDDPVEKHLPEFKGQMLVAARDKDTITLKKPSRPITVRDLLTHTSGLPDRNPFQADLYGKHDHTLAEAVMAFSQQPLISEPGTKWAYCNMGIDTLGRLIEVVSGQRYEEFLDKRLFQPLGMIDSVFFPTKEHLARAAAVGNNRDGKLMPLPPAADELPGAKFAQPCGGLWTTGADLVRLYQMMLGKGTLGKARILSEESVAAMTKEQTELRPGATSTGFGWAIVRKPEGANAGLSPGSFGHGGAFKTNAWIDPKQNFFTIVLIQRSGEFDPNALRREIQTLAASLK